MKSQPALCAAFASNRSSRVLVVWAPIATGTLPAEAAATVSATILRSSKVMAEKSPPARRPAARRSSLDAALLAGMAT